MIKQRPPCESEVGANFTPPRPRGVGGLGGRGGKPAGGGGLLLGSRRLGVVGWESSGSRQTSQPTQRAGRGGTRSKRAGKRQQAKAKNATA